MARFLAALFSVMIGAIVFEAGFRLFAPPGPPSYQRVLAPYLMDGLFKEPGSPSDAVAAEQWGYARRGGAFVFDHRSAHEDLGQRWPFLFADGREWLSRPEDRKGLLVFVIGASVAQGDGASTMAQRWYHKLERNVTSQLGVETHVIPVAAPSYVSSQERIVSEFVAFPSCPDLVIFLDGYNDANAVNTGAAPGDPYDTGVAYSRASSPMFEGLFGLQRYSRVIEYLVTHSVLNAIGKNLGEVSSDPARLANYKKSTAGVYLENLSQMLRSCRARGIACLSFLQPMRPLSRRLLGHTDSPAYEPVLEAYDAFKREAPRYLGDVAPQIDLTGIADSAARLDQYVDDCHFNDEGQTGLADAVTPFVVRQLRNARAKSESLRCRDGWAEKN